jgi:hypothetical protein
VTGATEGPAESVFVSAIPAGFGPSAAGFTATVPQLMTNVYARLPVQPRESVAVTVNVKLPVCIGVPERTPAAESERPAGSEPAETANVYGATPPTAASVLVRATPAVPAASAAGLTVIVAQTTNV